MLKSRATWKIREFLFRTNLNLLRVPKRYVLLTLRDQNASECKFQQQTIFFWMSCVCFRMFRWFYEKPIFPMGKRMFAISPGRIDWKSDPNLGLEWLKNMIILQCLNGERVRSTQKNIIARIKHWILATVPHYELKSRARVVCITICHECSIHIFF